MLYGVIEGFYGRPYSMRHRRILIRYLSHLDNAAFIYAPKNDPYHRLRWREDYPQKEWLQLTDAFDSAAEAELDFIFGISPWQFQSGDSRNLRRKVQKALDAGASGVAVLFDDIPEKADTHLAVRQIRLAEKALDGFDCRIYLCPSVYCTELLERYDGGEYLSAWRENIPADWKSFWTGDSVISRELDRNAMIRGGELLGGKPVVWDNLLADDYCLRRIYLAGIQNRIPSEHSYFLNPSSCFPVALHAVYMLLQASGVNCSWPSELGDMHDGWDILSGFHYLPHTAGNGIEFLLEELKTAVSLGPSEVLMEKLGSISSVLGRFIDSLEAVEDGFELMPYAIDVKKMISWWEDALTLSRLPARIARLEYLMYKRLPFDHPLSMITAELITKNGKGG